MIYYIFHYTIAFINHMGKQDSLSDTMYCTSNEVFLSQLMRFDAEGRRMGKYAYFVTAENGVENIQPEKLGYLPKSKGGWYGLTCNHWEYNKGD